MALSLSTSTEMNGRYGGNRPRPRTAERTRHDYTLIETDITDLAQAASRIEALRSLVLIFLREVDSLKKVIGPRPRKVGGAIKLDNEIDSFEAALIRDALMKSKGNQRDAAKLLSIKPTTLHAKMKRLGISVETTVTAVE